MKYFQIIAALSSALLSFSVSADGLHDDWPRTTPNGDKIYYGEMYGDHGDKWDIFGGAKLFNCPDWGVFTKFQYQTRPDGGNVIISGFRVTCSNGVVIQIGDGDVNNPYIDATFGDDGATWFNLKTGKYIDRIISSGFPDGLGGTRGKGPFVSDMGNLIGNDGPIENPDNCRLSGLTYTLGDFVYGLGGIFTCPKQTPLQKSAEQEREAAAQAFREAAERAAARATAAASQNGQITAASVETSENSGSGSQIISLAQSALALIVTAGLL